MTNIITIIILGAGVLFFILDQYWGEKYIEYINEATYWKKQSCFWMEKYSRLYSKYLEQQYTWLHGKYLEQQLERNNSHESNIS